MNPTELFKNCYAATHRAADFLSDQSIKEKLSRDDSRALVGFLREALCAAQELDNRAHGHEPARIGD